VYPFIGLSFEREKSRIMNLYSSVLSDMNKDHESLAIDPGNIMKISKSILNFSRELQSFSRNSKKLKPEQIIWLMGIINEFSDTLDLWMHRHTDELNIQKESLMVDETSDVS
jgi:hypothetical protein